MIVTFIVMLIILAIALIGSIIMLKDDDNGAPWFFGMLFGACFVASCVIAGELKHPQCQIEVQEYTVNQEITVVNGDTTCVKYIIDYRK